MAKREIWRWGLMPGGTTLSMPRDTQILSVGTKDGDKVEMWGIVEPGRDVPTVERMFTAIGTGHPWLDDPTIEMDYLGTVVLLRGTLVVHVFEGIATATSATDTERGVPSEW